MTMSFSPHYSLGVRPREASSTALDPEHPGWREAPNDFSDIPRQVHSLLKRGLNDIVQDICTTEQFAHSLKNPNGSFNRQAIISSQNHCSQEYTVVTTRL